MVDLVDQLGVVDLTLHVGLCGVVRVAEGLGPAIATLAGFWWLCFSGIREKHCQMEFKTINAVCEFLVVPSCGVIRR